MHIDGHSLTLVGVVDRYLYIYICGLRNLVITWISYRRGLDVSSTVLVSVYITAHTTAFILALRVAAFYTATVL